MGSAGSSKIEAEEAVEEELEEDEVVDHGARWTAQMLFQYNLARPLLPQPLCHLHNH